MTALPSLPSAPAWPLPVHGGAYRRASGEQIAMLDGLGSATTCARMHHMGVTRTFVEGPRPMFPGRHLVGSALTLQFMPQREDIASGVSQEVVERTTALWAVLEEVQPGDVLVIQANASPTTGCLGDMLVRYFKRKGGAGIVVDGRIRDSERVRELGVPIWCTGTTPHYASQSEQFPWAYDVPVAVGGTLCLPGDLVLADDDGVVVVPQAMAGDVAAATRDHAEWEVFSRQRLDEGARLSDYYPLSADTRAEYEAWRAAGPA